MADGLFGPYRLLTRLGSGGMGEVWRALDTRKGREVALKMIRADLDEDSGFARRFHQEAELAARLTSPHLVPIHDYGEIDGQLFLDMALIEGVDLGRLIRRDGKLAPDRAVTVIGQVARALGVAHRAGLVHRDVKPSNVLVGDNDGDQHAYLIDFGIVRALEGTKLTVSGAILGTLAYMAPERFDGEGDQRSDVYALACVLYEAVTGRTPFRSPSTPGLIYAHVNTPPPRVSDLADVPAALDEVIARGMAKKPGDRFPGAAELAAAARAALATRDTAPVDRARAADPPPPRRERDVRTPGPRPLSGVRAPETARPAGPARSSDGGSDPAPRVPSRATPRDARPAATPHIPGRAMPSVPIASRAAATTQPAAIPLKAPAVDRRPRRSRMPIVVAASVLAVLAATALLGNAWANQQYYVGAGGDRVVVYQGVQGSVLGFRLSSEAEDSGLTLDDLQPSDRASVMSGITATSGLDGAHGIIERLRQHRLPPCATTTPTTAAPAPAAPPGAAPVQPGQTTTETTPLPHPTLIPGLTCRLGS